MADFEARNVAGVVTHGVFQGCTARGRVFGARGAPAVAVIGGVSGTRIIAHDDPAGPCWWPIAAGAHCAFDPRIMRLVGLDYLPDAAFAEHLVANGLHVTASDQAYALRSVLDAAGIDHVAAIVGASYGGQVTMAAAAAFPERIGQIAVISAAAKPHPMAQAWRSIQQAILEDAIARGEGARGVDLARRLAMTTYRTHEEFAERFRDNPPTPRDALGAAPYLEARGGAYAAATSAERMLVLSRSMNRAELDVSPLTTPARFVAVDTDRLVPSADMEATAHAWGGPSTLAEFTSLYGHDAFLKERDIPRWAAKDLVGAHPADAG